MSNCPDGNCPPENSNAARTALPLALMLGLLFGGITGQPGAAAAAPGTQVAASVASECPNGNCAPGRRLSPAEFVQLQQECPACADKYLQNLHADCPECAEALLNGVERDCPSCAAAARSGLDITQDPLGSAERFLASLTDTFNGTGNACAKGNCDGDCPECQAARAAECPQCQPGQPCPQCAAQRGNTCADCVAGPNGGLQNQDSGIGAG